MSQRKYATPTILLVEDEAEVRRMIGFNIERVGYSILEAESAEDALRYLGNVIPDLIIIDRVLPGMNGLEFARYVRRDATEAVIPVMMLTAPNDEADNFLGFDSGVDDYLVKPFSPKELLSRVKALLRQTGSPDDNILVVGRLRADLSNHSLLIDGTQIQLGPTEFRLLAWLAQNSDQAFTRSQLLDRVWGRNVYLDERTVDVHIMRLRSVLKPFQLRDCLVTVRSIGYRFSAAAAENNSNGQVQ